MTMETGRSASQVPGIGLALGGGGARGYAHIGVLKALVSAGIPIDCISGTSMGAVVGAAYCAGATVDEMVVVAQDVRWMWLLRLADLTTPRRGMIVGRHLERYFCELTKGKDFSEFDTNLTVVATDVTTGEEVRLTSGPVWRALHASTAFPGVFCPVESGIHLLIDGSVTTPVPVAAAVAMGARLTIGVDVSSAVGRMDNPTGTCEEWFDSACARNSFLPRNLRLPAIVKSLLPESLAIVGRSIRLSGQDAHERPDSSVQVWRLRPAVQDMGWYEFRRAKDCIRAGEAAGQLLVDNLKPVLSRLGSRLDEPNKADNQSSRALPTSAREPASD